MSIATVTSKSQITVPAQVRKVLGVRPGSHLAFIQTSDRSFTVTSQTPTLTSLFGALKAPRPATLEDMEQGIANGATRSAKDTNDARH